MKRIILIVILNVVCLYSIAQTTTMKFRAFGFNYRYTLENGQKSDISEMSETDILITLTDSRIKVYSKEHQTYDIISYYDFTGDNGNHVDSYKCIDNEGLQCSVLISLGKDDTWLFLILYSDCSWSYRAYFLDN